MSEIDFQNGFICGMATKGLVKSGAQYTPNAWNDEGVYDFFYIDFKQALELFSLGMLQESIILHDSAQVFISGVEYVSPGLYKIFCDLENRFHGVTVINKITTYLRFATGRKVFPFSIHFYVNGIVPHIIPDFCYDNAIYNGVVHGDIYENSSSTLCENVVFDEFDDTTSFVNFLPSSVDEDVSVELT